MAAHARYFGASAAHRWMRCAAAPKREEKYPNKGSKYAREGTAAHTLMEWALLSEHKNAAHFIGNQIDVHEYDEAGNKFVAETFQVDAVMAGYVQTAVDYVVTVLQANPGADLFVESKVCYRPYLAAAVQDDEDEGFGTADVIIIAGDEIIVVDLKYGQGKRVKAEGNEQLQLYALGAYEDYGLLSDLTRARLVICQPRVANGTSEWVCSIDDLKAFGERARAASHVVLASNPPAVPGDEQCKFCRAKAGCPEAAREAMTAVVGDFEDLTQAAELLPQPVESIDLSAIYPKLHFIKKWVEAVEERMVEEVGAGLIPGWELGEGRRGARAWADPSAAEATLKAMRLKKEEMYDFKLITPAAAEKLLKDTPRRWSKLEKLITQPAGKLVPRRCAVVKPAEVDFGADADLI